MKKKPIFGRVILSLYFLVLLVIAVFVVQIKMSLPYPNKETLVQKIMYNFPKVIKMHQKVVNDNNLEFTIKDKNITQKISAPVVKVFHDYWGEQYSETRYYSPKDENNRLVYVSLNTKSLYKKKADFNDLVKAKVIYADKYEFDCFSIKTTKDKTDFSSNISLMPLQSQDVYLVAELPRDFVNTKNSMNLEIFIGNTKYIVKLR